MHLDNTVKGTKAQSIGAESTYLNKIIYTLVSVKKCYHDSVTLENIMTIYLKTCQMHEKRGKPIFLSH